MVNQQLRRHEDSTIHRYPRQGSEEHENPTNDITLYAPMLQPIMTSDELSETKTSIDTNSPINIGRKKNN